MSDSETSTSTLTDSERVGHYIEMWKQATQVNQHFNDIEWRIRGLALTVATFSIGAAGVSAREGAAVFGVSVGSLLLVVGLLLWYAFYFVDLAWYHQLLRASVRQTEEIEKEIGKVLPVSGHATAITAGSAYQPNGLIQFLSRRETMQSTDKLMWFYRVGAVALLLVAIGLQIFSMQTAPVSDPMRPQVTINLDRDGHGSRAHYASPSGPIFDLRRAEHMLDGERLPQLRSVLGQANMQVFELLSATRAPARRYWTLPG